MKRFLNWFTRGREEAIFGFLMILGMVGVVLHANGFHHPIHLEVDHEAIERDHRRASDEASKAAEQDAIDESMRKFEERMEEGRRQSEAFGLYYEKWQREMEAETRWQEKEDAKIREAIEVSRSLCRIEEIDG